MAFQRFCPNLAKNIHKAPAWPRVLLHVRECQSELVFPGGFKRGRRKMQRSMQRCMYERETPFCYREKLMRAAHDHGGSFNPVLWLYVMLSMVVNQRGCDVTKVSKIVNSNRKV